MSAITSLGFPPPLLGMEPVRLPVFHCDSSLMVLGKPAGVLVQQDSWYPRLPVLVEAIRYQAEQGKPEFQRAGIGPDGLWAVSDLDPELPGPVVFCFDRDERDRLKNALGSGSFLFRFTFLSAGRVEMDELECDLPLARHTSGNRVIVSHSTGKQCRTRFLRSASVGNLFQWVAESGFPRRHQVLVHAMESGLPVLGDELYAGSSPLLLSSLKSGYRPSRFREERPLYPGPACFLREIQFPDKTSPLVVPPPAKWRALLNQLNRIPQAK